MKKYEQYGQRKNEEWEWFPWLPWWPPETRPPFKIRTKPEDIAPFFFVDHHPYALSLLLKISDGFKADTFHKMGLKGSSKDWETLVTGFIGLFSRLLRAACDDEKRMRDYFYRGSQK